MVEPIDLFNVCKPESPIWFVKSDVFRVLEDLGEVELRGVPAADAVVGPEVSLALEVKRRRPVPLKKNHSAIMKT